ncbi:MAG: acyl-CoA thioesterase [Alkalispirochaeta sp.]
MSAHLPVSRDRSEFHHCIRYSVRYDDLDTYRHVNNKAFLSYIEDARVRYLVDAGGFRHHQDRDTGETDGVMLVHSSIDYLAQIHPFETVDVFTRTARVGRSSITLHHLLIAHSPSPATGPRRGETTGPEDTGPPKESGRPEESGLPEEQGFPKESGRPLERIAAVSVTVLASVDLRSGTSRPNDPAFVARINAFESAGRP